MQLTEALKNEIDQKSYEELLSRWRFDPVGEEVFQGESGKYWAQRMSELRHQPGGQEMHVTISKKIGWGD